MVGQHARQPLAQAFRPGADHDARAALLQRADMRGGRIEDVGVLVRPFGEEYPPLARSQRNRLQRAALRHGERREGDGPRMTRLLRPGAGKAPPARPPSDKAIPAQRLVGRGAGGQRVEAGLPALEVVRSLRQPLLRGVERQMVEDQRRAGRIVREPLMPSWKSGVQCSMPG